MRIFTGSALFLIFLFLVTANLFAQNRDTVWTKAYGGSEEDRGEAVCQTNDGGYIIVGETKSCGSGGYDVYLIKTDSLGDSLWARAYGGSSYDLGYSVQQATDGGYIVVGETYSYGAGENDVFLIKTDSCGDTLWTKTYGGSSYDRGYSVQQTDDGGYIVAGYTCSYGAGFRTNIYLIKTDSLGDSLWARTYGDTLYEEARSVLQTSDGGYIVTGKTKGGICLMRMNSIGDSLWTRTYGGAIGYSVQNTDDRGYFVVGIRGESSNPYIYLVKTDSLGQSDWIREYTSGSHARSGQQTVDEGYIVAGQKRVGGNLEVYLLKLDSLGDSLWAEIYGGSQNDWPNSVRQTNDGGYIIAGCTNSYGAPGRNVYLIKTESECGIGKEDTSEIFLVSKVDPNPFHNKTIVKYQLPKDINVHITFYNALGQVVRDLENMKKNKGIHTVIWDGTDKNGKKLSSGIYFLRIEAGENKATRKLLLMR